MSPNCRPTQLCKLAPILLGRLFRQCLVAVDEPSTTPSWLDASWPLDCAHEDAVTLAEGAEAGAAAAADAGFEVRIATYQVEGEVPLTGVSIRHCEASRFRPMPIAGRSTPH